MSKDRRLVAVLALNVLMIAALVVVGVAAGSLGVLAAGGDYAGDAVGVAISLLALRLSRRPHGHPRATSYAALFNATLLLLVTVVVIADALRRLIGGAPPVDGLPVIAVSIAAAVVMGVCALIIGTVERDDFNMRSVLLDTLADGVAALGVATAGIVMLLAGGLYWLDPVVALAIAAVIAVHALRLIREVTAALRPSPPERHARAHATRR